MAASTQHIQTILSYQKSMARPSQDICKIIGSLKDLCELNGTNVEWRRGTGAGNASPGGRPVFRSPSSGSMTPSTPSFRGAVTANSGSPKSSFTPPESPTPYSPLSKNNVPYSAVRYQSQFKNSSQPVEDKILNNIILSKLNKFSSTTYTEIRDFLYQILGSGDKGDSDVGDMVRQFMLMVFKKAASEEIYCSLYAKLLAEISVRYSVILEEMHTLQENYLMIFDEVEEKEDQEKYETFVTKNIEKRYRQGYSQFIAELSILEIMKLSYLEQTFRRIFEIIMKNAAVPEKRTLLEEYADCLARMSGVFKKKSSKFLLSARSSLLAISKPTIDTILSQKDAYPSVSPKVRFILMDVKDNLTA